MSVNSTTKQVYIPGFQERITSLITPLLTLPTASLTALNSQISNFTGLNAKFANTSMAITDSEVSPYPLFGIWTNQNNDRLSGYSVINSDFQVVATSRSNNRLSGNWQDVQLSDLSDFYEDFRGWTYTNGNPGGGGNTTYSGGGTNLNGHEGNHLYSFKIFGNYSTTDHNRADQFGQFTKRSGTLIGVKGVRNRLNHYSNDSNFQVRQRGQVHGYVDTIDLNSTVYANWAGKTNRGMSSYNDRTKTLCIAESNTANAIRLHVWKNANVGRGLNTFDYYAGTLHNFFSEAKTAGPNGTTASYSFYDFTWSSSGSTQAEPSYVMRLVMGDNGKIGFSRFSPQSNGNHYGWFTPTGVGSTGVAGTGAFTDSGANLGNTTSYSIDQGDTYGIRTNISWDNQWLISYAPYHYYHNGINLHCINTQDPTKYYTWRNTDGSNGTSPVPYGESSFVMCYSVQNGDGPGPYLYMANPGAAYELGYRNDGTTVAIGGDLQPWNVGFSHIFDTVSHTTQYPHITTMPHWTTI